MAGEKIGSIYYDLDLDDKKFQKTAKNVKSEVDNIGNSFNEARNASLVFAGALSVVAVATGAYIKEATLTAARTETLGVAMNAVAKATNTSMDTILAEEKSLKKLGITTQEARSTLTKFMQSQLDVTQASKLARVAQDLAVIAGENSSQTTARLTDAIATMNPMLLRQVGIVKNTEEVFEAYGATIGKAGDELTEVEKKQALVSLILLEGEKVAGTYEAAMDTAGKKLGSLDRYFEEAANTIGVIFLPYFGQLIDSMTLFLQSVTPEKVQEVLDVFIDNLPIIIGFILGGLAPAVWAAVVAFGAWLLTLAPFILIGALIGFVIKLLVDKLGGWNNVMTTLTNLYNEKVKPALDSFKDTLNPLWVEIKAIYDLLSPYLIPILKLLALIVGGIIITGIKLFIAYLSLLAVRIAGGIATITWVLEQFKYFIAGVFATYGESMIKAIDDAIATVQSAFWGLWASLSVIFEKIKKGMEKLNPFHRESPSLVDNVLKGIDQIKNAYEGVGTMNLPSVADMSVNGGLISQNPVQIVMNNSGIVARSRSEFRDIMADGIDAVNDMLRARGLPELGNGSIKGSTL